MSEAEKPAARTPAHVEPPDLPMPADLKRRLEWYVDVDEVGAAGFWLWLGTVLPLLPTPSDRGSRRISAEESPTERLREVAKDLVDCARERARLTVMCDQYFRDNQVLARRLKALEATLRTFERTGQGTKVPRDAEADAAAPRYLPVR